MFSSPSLGPPLLSASWSPPLFCGMPAVELAAPEPPDPACEAEADGADVADDGALLDPPPQPAAAITSAATTATPAAIKRDLRISVPISRATHQRGLAGSIARRGS